MTDPKDTNEGIPVKKLLVHQPATVKGMTDTNLQAQKGYVMFYRPDGVHVQLKDEKFIVPLSNVVIAVLF